MLMFKIKKNIILKYFKIKNIFKKHNPPHSKKKKKTLKLFSTDSMVTRRLL